MNKYRVRFKDHHIETIEAGLVQIIGGTTLDKSSEEGMLTFYVRIVKGVKMNGPFRGIALDEIAEWELIDTKESTDRPTALMIAVVKYLKGRGR